MLQCLRNKENSLKTELIEAKLFLTAKGIRFMSLNIFYIVIKYINLLIAHINYNWIFSYEKAAESGFCLNFKKCSIKLDASSNVI